MVRLTFAPLFCVLLCALWLYPSECFLFSSLKPDLKLAIRSQNKCHHPISYSVYTRKYVHKGTVGTATSETLITLFSSLPSTVDNERNVDSKYRFRKNLSSLWKALKNNWLILGEIFVIALAQYNPALGATGGILRPEITISKIGVFIIFFINGVALSLGGTPSELKQATQTNLLIQFYNFGFIPLFVKLFAKYYPDPTFR